MKNLYTKISINIIIVFTIVIIMSIIPSLYPKLFGDWLCEGRIYQHDVYNKDMCIRGIEKGCDYTFGDRTSHNPKWHWGYQHWLYFIMGICLFIVQAFRIGSIINKEND